MTTIANTTTCRCALCNGEIEFETARNGETITCPWCAHETELYIPGGLVPVSPPVAAPFSPPPHRKNDAGETVFLQEGGFYVTNARFVAGNQTFSVANIASVQAVAKTKRIFWPLVSLFFSAPLFASAASAPNTADGGKETMFFLMGLWLAVTIIVLVRRLIPEYQLRIVTSGATITAFESRRWSALDRVAQALNEAIIARG